jgi:pyruvate dehydrogenase E1 component beta subunit
MPIAENGMTGVCIGAALAGVRPIIVHQRIDFILLAMDQLINNAAKWHYMFNGQQTVPIVVRLIVGRGWGQGPQHSQGLHKLFTQIPGLKVFMPVTASDAYHMMMAAIKDEGPVVFIEHRWLHSIRGCLDKTVEPKAVDKLEVIRQGTDITLVAFSYMVVETLKAAEYLQEHKIQIEVLSISNLTTMDIQGVQRSLLKTGCLIVADNACEQASLGHEIISSLCRKDPGLFQTAPKLIAWPNHPVPTSPYLAEHYYPDCVQIVGAIFQQLNKPYDANQVKIALSNEVPTDIPNASFTGPF